MSNLNAVLRQLKSEKSIKERQEGLASLRAAFERDSTVDNFDEKGEGKSWLVVFQALFEAVQIEREAYRKKPTVATANRLSYAASTVRWLTERSVHRWNKKVSKALLRHLLQTMVDKGALRLPVALDYINALRCIVSRQAHLDHLDDESWVSMVELAFNVVLGDPLRRSLEDEGEGDDENMAHGMDDSEFYQDAEEDTDETSSRSTFFNARKRRRVTARPTTSSHKSKVVTSESKPTTSEQKAFTSLLAALLRASSTPLLSESYPNLASSILRRLRRFLDIYPIDTSLHEDYLLALSATLSHLSLNKRSDVEVFARASWDDLVALWGTKTKRLKEGLVVVLRIIFPFLTATQGGEWEHGVRKLWQLLDAEAESRWGVDGLSLESLRLEVTSDTDQEGETRGGVAFIAQTFRAGWQFDSAQALAWAILELQADCAEKLFILSESVHISVPKEGKRTKMESPIASLLYSIQTRANSNVRSYHLQVLLFFIDRHWSILHDSLQQDVLSTLLQFVSFDDSVIQSWTFMCFAAVAYHDGSFPSSIPNSQLSFSQSTASQERPRDAVTWDPIWTHAIRRANVPTVCRAACHTAYVLLTGSKSLLTSSRVLVEIESLAKDLDVQGPSFPYDAVCVFLAQCLRTASQDVRLYRMLLEEKVLSWLIDSWDVTDGRSGRNRMPLYMIGDILRLLESICGFGTGCDLVERILLPECPIVETLVEESRTKVIRQFLLYATLPPFLRPSVENKRGLAGSGSKHSSQSNTTNGMAPPLIKDNDLAQPGGRERKISAFMLKFIELLIVEWETAKQTNVHPTAVRARWSIDTAVIAISFEALLIYNGTKSNRRVVQAACRLVVLVSSLLTDPRWTVEEKALVSMGLQPLIESEKGSCEAYEASPWEAMLPPDSGTGIKSQTLRRLRSDMENRRSFIQALRREFQKVVWHSVDVQEAFAIVAKTLRDLLKIVTRSKQSDSRAMDVDDKDGFGPIRTTPATGLSIETQRTDNAGAKRCIAEICVSFLTVVPLLQSSSGEPTRDKELTELVLGCTADDFILVGYMFFNKVRQRTLNLSVNNLDNFLEKLESLLKEYAWSRSEKLQLLVVCLLHSTLHLWLQRSVASADTGHKIRLICDWISQILVTKKIRYWKVRDCVAQLLDKYLSLDPHQEIWSTLGDEGEGYNALPDSELPHAMLPSLGADEDIRVRFRTAVLSPRLFSVARAIGRDPMLVYVDIKQHLTVILTKYEHMLTRMLTLGNIMIVSSASRRGPYWHLLETCLHVEGTVYQHHIAAILESVAERMGLDPFSQLFEAYAYQMAYSIRKAGLDFLLFPPQMLGYDTRKECAEAAFRAFTPANVLANGLEAGHGQKLFVNHCTAIKITTAEGIRDCFGDICGFQIVSWIDSDAPLDSLEKGLHSNMEDIGGSAGFEECLRSNVDGVVVAILRSLGDQELDLIIDALRRTSTGGDAARTFAAITRYRNAEDFQTHTPNLPAFNARTILQALEWFSACTPDVKSHATSYHVLHELFSNVHRSPLVNEQVRLLNALCLWVAFRHGDFQNSTLLYTLIRGAASLLAQSDLAHAAQSILEWAFGRYRKIGHKDFRFPDLLIRICCTSHDYSRSKDVSVSKLGADMLRWVDTQALAFCKVPALRGQIVKALPAWPQEPSPDLTQIYEDISSESLSGVLGDHRISSNKFRLARRLCELAVKGDYESEQFAKFDFWRLRECIPASEHLQDEDTDAFAALLVLSKGHIHSFGSDQQYSSSIRARYLGAYKKKSISSPGDDSIARYAVVLSLLAMLDGNDMTQVHVAYRTLRLLMSVANMPQLFAWPTENRTELEFLQSYRSAPKTRVLGEISDLLTSAVYMDNTRDFPRWITTTTILLTDVLGSSDPFYVQLKPILEADPSFAEEMLPVLVHIALLADISEVTKNEPSIRALLSGYYTAILTSDYAHVSCRRAIVAIVLLLRNFRPPHTDEALVTDKWLNLDYTLLSRNAIICGAYTTALLFLELAAEYRDASASEDPNAEQVLFDIYSHIDEPDGFYGINSKDHHQFLIKRFHHEKQWDKAFRFHGAALEAGSKDSASAEGLLQSFHSFGFDHLAIDTLQGPSIGGDSSFNSTSMSYRLGWRTETWDLPEQTTNPGSSLYLVLRAIHRERDPNRIDAELRHSLAKEMGRIRDLGAENLAEIREVTQNLMCLCQVTRWRSTRVQERLAVKHIDLQEWNDFIHLDGDFEFSDLENIIATRVSLIRSVRRKEERDQIGNILSPFALGLIDVEKHCLVRLSEAARDARQIQIALNSVVRAQRLERTASFDVCQEFASVLWLQKEERLAVQFLEDLLNGGNAEMPTLNSIDSTRRALLLARLGAWTSEACLKKPTDILARYFDPATSLATAKQLPSFDPTYATVYHQCAIFTEHQYHAILKSPDAIRWKVYVDRKIQEIQRRGEEIARLKSQPHSKEYQELTQIQRKAEALLVDDQSAFRRHNGARDAFLQQAIDMYSRCLQASDTFDNDSAIRLCSLWFANFDDMSLQEKAREAFDRVPSRKFIFLAHQLSARLATLQPSLPQKSQGNLQRLIVRMCEEHPFHSLYQVYCLRPDRSSSNLSAHSSRHSLRQESPASQTDRAAAAAHIFDRLRSDTSTGERVRAVEQVCDASLQWAKHPIKTDGRYKVKHKGPFQIPGDLLIKRISSMRVPVITAHTQLDPTLRYDNCVWIERYDHTFETAGGINLPKINICYGSDGEKYKQLFKGEGNDDLRQDAVMEQVFDLVNVVLRRDRETKRRNLSVRDYKVIPLASQAGVLEFVGNTTPIGEWLARAHVRYRPNDLKHKDIEAKLDKKRKECRGQTEPLLALFLKIREEFKPVMRHYFTERHKIPISWFAMRLAYARSVATNSIVGHVLGLGDRHFANILIDNVTGEVVHIDLGIAFDQGKILPVPERVPFRMTADVVDGLGISGTQGVFQRCAEETLRVLREGSEVIMTVLEVFKHDPLHSWTASELKVKRVQGNTLNPISNDTARYGIGIDMTSGTADEAADRALASVARKLNKTLSVEYTVNELIAEATDPVNLATIFCGWGPHL